MEQVLICHGGRAVRFLAQTAVVAVPILGESLVNCWMELLANAGVKEVSGPGNRSPGAGSVFGRRWIALGGPGCTLNRL